MLRFKLGDAAFFQGVKNYLADPDLAYSFAITPDLLFHMEAVSGMELDEYFADWVYGEGYPIYNVTAQNVGSGQAKIIIYQGQSHPSVGFFEMPVPVTLYGSNGAQATYMLNNDSDIQTFFVDVPFVVTNVAFDVENDILSAGNTASLSTESIDLLQSVMISPNPVSSILNISISDNIEIVDVSVFNVLGQKLLSANSTQVDVSGLPSGMHLIKITTSAGLKQMNFIKN
jgi:hypothetical protein